MRIIFAIAAVMTLSACGPITSRLDELNGQLETTNTRLASIDENKLASIDSRLSETNRRLANVEIQLAATNEKLETLEGAVKRVPGLSSKD